MDAREARTVLDSFRDWVAENFSERERQIIYDNVVGKAVGIDTDTGDFKPKVILSYLKETQGEEYLKKYGNDVFYHEGDPVRIEYNRMSSPVRVL